MEKDPLSILHELTDKLPTFPEGFEDPRFNKYRMEKGTCLSWHLFDNELCAIDKWFISCGTIMQPHTHISKEVITIYDGSMDLILDGVLKKLFRGDVAYINPGQIHSSTYSEDCWFITLTIPPAKEFLHGRIEK